MTTVFRSAIMFSLGAYFVLLFLPVAYGATEIQGTVTAKRADSVKVEFKPHKTIGPQTGDQVDFKTKMQGLEVNAGQGEVTESESGFIWVKIKNGRPNLKMAAFIHATGKPVPPDTAKAEMPRNSATPATEVAREKEYPANIPEKETAEEIFASRDKLLLVLSTSKGTITVELDKKRAPATIKNIIDYALNGFYDGTIFHRVIKGFMIQGGGFTQDMQKKNTNAPVINEADNGLKNVRGTIAMARTQDPHSATAQFFINTKNNNNLDHRGKNKRGWGYCVFGKVVSGMEVVDAIEAVVTTRVSRYRDVPQDPVIINKASIQ